MSASDKARLRDLVIKAVRDEGFDTVGITTPASIPLAAPRLKTAIADGHHATMAWLADTGKRRSRPDRLWADVRSIVMVGMNYGPDVDPLAALTRRQSGAISVYARHRDYHGLVKGALKRAATNFIAAARRKGIVAEVKVFVDTAPVMEKPLAEAAGLGWLGKHTNLVSRELGSWLFLGALFTDQAIAPDTAETDHCGSCRACLDICPTDAFPAPYRLDARRCISYLTIEHKGPIDRPLRAKMGNRIFGCDDCLAVCPWNKFATVARDARLQARDDLVNPQLAELATLDDLGFRKRFSGSPIKRIGRDRFIRNVMIAIGNSDDDTLATAARPLLFDGSALVRGAAVWALSRLLPQGEFRSLADRHRGAEVDPDVLTEWNHGERGEP